MNKSKSQVWKKIGCFYALTMLFSFAFGAFILRAGKLEAGNLLYVTGSMCTSTPKTYIPSRLFAVFVTTSF